MNIDLRRRVKLAEGMNGHFLHHFPSNYPWCCSFNETPYCTPTGLISHFHPLRDKHLDASLAIHKVFSAAVPCDKAGTSGSAYLQLESHLHCKSPHPGLPH